MTIHTHSGAEGSKYNANPNGSKNYIGDASQQNPSLGLMIDEMMRACGAVGCGSLPPIRPGHQSRGMTSITMYDMNAVLHVAN